MAVKKATSAIKKGAPAKKAAPARTASSKTNAGGARAAGVTVAKAAAKNGTAATAAAKSAVKKSAVKKAAVKKSAVKTVVPKPGATKAAATRTTAAKKTAAKKSALPGAATREAAPPKAAVKASARPQRLRVRESEKPWTTRELATVRADLEADMERLQREISVAELDLVDLMRDAGEGSGDDQADAGTATFEREQEISLANNARSVFEQSARALARLLDGSYGVCESCGNPIGKNRLLAFPRATLCMTCKSKQERR